VQSEHDVERTIQVRAVLSPLLHRLPHRRQSSARLDYWTGSSSPPSPTEEGLLTIFSAKEPICAFEV